MPDRDQVHWRRDRELLLDLLPEDFEQLPNLAGGTFGAAHPIGVESHSKEPAAGTVHSAVVLFDVLGATVANHRPRERSAMYGRLPVTGIGAITPACSAGTMCSSSSAAR
ncbi:hypothetical protein Drose_30805 [Dactylosporangium roseum]|uniref:Uncharacterized protein n=1 Tax=Dactylosporangium roseum TaxID=47989 RepID=A0ABY5Z1E2_9ACTN|nr:hypothetical protein [Dactylosporangium roseum]UWZ35479.1 hypothetical protein Drose_30805 [Dactylosporangium roseum]